MTSIPFLSSWLGGETRSTRLDGAGVASDWTVSLTGGPGRPTRVGVLGFSDNGLFPMSPAPHTAPKFIGLSCYSQPGPSGSSQVGVAICTGPAPSGAGGAWTINESSLTPVATWLLAATDSLDSYVVPAVGDYYYLVVETWDSGANEALVVNSVFGGYEIQPTWWSAPGDEIPTFYPGVTGWSDEEEIFPPGQPVGIGVDVPVAAGSVSLAIDWGDGTVDNYGPYSVHDVRVARGETGHDLSWPAEGDFVLPVPPPGSGPVDTFLHTYTDQGLYTISVTMTDAIGGTYVKTKPVAVVGPPTATLDVSPRRVRLPGQVTITATATSPTWDLLGARDPADNPDGYDPTDDALGYGGRAHTSWIIRAGDHTAGDGYWMGVGPPPDGQSSGDPQPMQPTYVNDAHNETLLADGDPQPVTLVFGDYYKTWYQEISLEVDVHFTTYIPPVRQRQIPRNVRQRQNAGLVRQRQRPR